MEKRWFEVRVAIDGNLNLETLKNSFDKVAKPLYEFVNTLGFVDRSHYLHEPHKKIDPRTPYVWMIRWEIKNWKKNKKRVISEVNKFLSERGYVNSKDGFKKNKTFYISDDDGKGDAKTFTQEYYEFFYDFMNSICKLHKGVIEVNKRNFPQFSTEKIVHCMLNAYGYIENTEKAYHVQSLINRCFLERLIEYRSQRNIDIDSLLTEEEKIEIINDEFKKDVIRFVARCMGISINL